jgi:hypothetical protein
MSNIDANEQEQKVGDAANNHRENCNCYRKTLTKNES